MIVLYFGWLLDRAYGLMTHAAQRSVPMGIHWAFIGTFLGAAALTCIAKLYLTFKINMPLPIDVGKVLVWGGRPNPVCGLSCHISHHGTESMLLKNLPDVVKET